MASPLGEYTWTECDRIERRPLLVVPVGSCEQHGPHLPLDTDTRIAVALAERLVDSFGPGELLLAPALSITASGEHAKFPGTLSIGNEVFQQVVVELVRSADWTGGVVLVNGHAGNRAAVDSAVRQLDREYKRVLSWWPRVDGGDSHAGHTETSLMLTIAPQMVRMRDAEQGNTAPLSELIGTMRRLGVQAVSPNGVLGDPRRATAKAGRTLLTKLTFDLCAAVDEWWR